MAVISSLQVLLLLIQYFLLVLESTAAVLVSSNVIHPNCPDKCGDVNIPYPFGIGPGCFRGKGFEITCMDTSNGSKYPVLGPSTSTLYPINISLPEGQTLIHKNLSYHCYNASGYLHWHTSALDLRDIPFTISAVRNKFTAIGCDTIAFITGTNGRSYESGCMSFCNTFDTAKNSFSNACAGVGCCQTSIPENLVYYDVQFNRRVNRTGVQDFNPCSYGFVAQEDWFKFTVSDLRGINFYDKYDGWVPLVLDWVVGSETCEEAKKNSSYACVSSNSVCLNFTNGRPGYICNCSQGYQGNPYLQDGCRDINECELPHQYPCLGVCTNTEGNYNCSCPPGNHSDDPKTKQCDPIPTPTPNPNSNLPLWVKLTLGIGIGIVFLLVASFWIHMRREKRELAKEKERFFRQNGGLLLYDKIKSKASSIRRPTFKIFQGEELEKATNNFDKSQILGRGGHGTVYRGILDGNVVAIKKSRTIDESQVEEFVKEILILSQINHTNVVKLLGCCLEVEVPMLVYEFIANGTLYDYIHDQSTHTQQFSLDSRLRIAIQSAEALAYLHSSASPPILHGDVKSHNILLDQNYVAKVSDFGASTLIAIDETQLATVIQGTFGYLDPEYMQTYKITEKSDVYSFGVVLIELLTSKKPFYFNGSGEGRSLASIFLSSMKESQLTECLDYQLVNEGQIELLSEVSKLAKQCLNIKGEERPTMKEVVEGLQRLRKSTKHPWENIQNAEELEHLVSESSSFQVADTSTYYSFETRPILDMETGR